MFDFLVGPEANPRTSMLLIVRRIELQRFQREAAESWCSLKGNHPKVTPQEMLGIVQSGAPKR